MDKTLLNSLYRKPIYVAILYSLFTLLLYLYGPYTFPEYNRILLILFVIVTNILIYVGFVSGVSKNYRKNINNLKYININRLLKIFFYISLIVCVPKFIIYTGFYVNPIGKIAESIILFFAGASDVIYAARQEIGTAPGIWRYINYLVVIFGSIHWMYTPLSLFYWNKLSFFMKLGTSFIWGIYILQYICTGTNVGMFEFFIMLFIVRILRNLFDSSRSTIKKTSNSKNVILLVLLGVTLLFTFNFVMSSRIGDKTSSVPLGDTNAYLNHESLFWEYVPSAIQQVFMYVTRYLCVPYYALERAFDLSWNPTFGVGYSWFLLDNFPIDFWPDTYMMQLEDSIRYSHWSSWHTSYMWFANDVSFFGVPIVYFFLFKLFGKCWAMFLQTKNMCAFLMFMLFVKMVFFISANNQAFQASDHLFTFWELLFILGWSRKFKWE